MVEALEGFPATAAWTPFSVHQPDCNILSQLGKHLNSRNPRDFAPPGHLRRTRHKFRCTKPYEDQRFKKPDAHVTENLQKLKDHIKTSVNKRDLDSRRELTEKKKRTVPLTLRVSEGMSNTLTKDSRSLRNPLTRNIRRSALHPATRKRVASSKFPFLVLGKMKKKK